MFYEEIFNKHNIYVMTPKATSKVFVSAFAFFFFSLCLPGSTNSLRLTGTNGCVGVNPNSSTNVVNSNRESIGLVDFDCPEIFANFGDPCDDGISYTTNDAINSNCECFGSATVCVQVNNNLDDAEEDLATGAVSTSSGDLELVLDGPSATGPFINQLVGLRFNGHNIPKGVTITNAFIQFTADAGSGVNPCNLNIRGEARDNANHFTTTNNNISSRFVTNASVLWSPPDWNVGDNGAAQQTNDISAVLQEIIDRDGYAPGNPIAIIIDGEGKRTARSFDNTNEGAAILCVTYERVCPDSNNDSVCDDNVCPDGPEPGEPCNDGNPNTISDITDENCACVGIPGATFNVCSKINSSSDDAEENTMDGSVNLISGDIELMFEIPSGEPIIPQVVGLRFLNLNIPKGVIINSAHIQFTSEATINQDPSSIDIYGEASDAAITFSNITNNISNRSRTNASITDWSPIAWTSTGISGPDQQTPNIAAVIQEIVSRPGYTSFSPIAIIMEGIGKRTAISFDAHPINAAEICISYSIPQTLDSTYYRIYPVPTANDLKVALPNQFGKPIRILVYNQIGQLMEIIDIEEFPILPFVLNIEDYLNGVYFMRIEIENARSISQKFIVNRPY
jgi:Secretion system C-terminal sorting domain